MGKCSWHLCRAIVAALLAAGYSAAEMKKEIVDELDCNNFKDTSLLDRFPMVGPMASLIFEKGIYKGKFCENWMRELLQRKNVETFSDLIIVVNDLSDNGK